MERIFLILACACAVAFAQYSGPGVCKELNERHPVSGSCDRYIECINGTAEEKLCPDGLRFNPNVNFDVYPCQYPNEVACLERSALQPPQPTADCPHQFGYFKIGDARNCSGFRTCVNGVGYDFVCPDGLAFSSETYRCEWPDEVADCDAEAFVGFRCPEVPISKELGPPAGFRFYGSDNDCQKYFLCIDGRPRVLSCGGESGFDELTSSCVSADEVPTCPPELKAAAANTKELQKQYLAKELEFNALQAKRKALA
ncbi:protein obstructor-E [Manduca sexta]|uniref:protein obstructor-E n=1 Tax=Manduca sexta TaxID=7130 RepID=UPI00188FB62E|nr:protein obstructor-E [Manduca sexta]